MREHTWKPGQVFVFGSNLMGMHAGGAARFAVERCMAEDGVGQGFASTASYALPTCSTPGQPLSLETVRAAVTLFIAVAKLYLDLYPNLTFFVTAVGCGIAGFAHEDIAPMFRNAPSNCILPPEWDELSSVQPRGAELSDKIAASSMAANKSFAEPDGPEARSWRNIWGWR